MRGRGAGHGERVPRVVNLGVVVAHRARQPVRGQRGGQLQRAAGGQVPVMRNGPVRSFHRVVEGQPGPDVRPLDHLLVQREQERDGLDQMRGELGHQQVAFPQRLADQLEVELLQVPQPAVDQLARPARGARGQVARLHQGDPQAAGRGVQRRPRTGDPAADDQHVEPLGAQPAEHRAAVAGVEDRAVACHHRSPIAFGYVHRQSTRCPLPAGERPFMPQVSGTRRNGASREGMAWPISSARSTRAPRAPGS